MSTDIILVDARNDRRWDAFVANHPMGTVYHSSAWGQVLESTYGYTPRYLALVREHEFEGIFPLFLVEHRLTRKKLISLPFTAYCKMLIPETELENVIRFTRTHISASAVFEMKFYNGDDIELATLDKRSTYVTHVLTIDSRLENTFRTFHDTSIRQKIKRAAKSGLTFRLGSSERDLQAFHKLSIGIRKRHGLPPHPYKFFLNMWTILKPKNLMILPIVQNGPTIVAAGLILKSKDTYHLEYSASRLDSLKLFPNHKLIWDSIQIAHREGVRYFDFGRSSISNRSLVEFKERWGASAVELPYYYHPRSHRPIVDEVSSPGIVHRLNKILPDFLLRLEGNIIYRFLR